MFGFCGEKKKNMTSFTVKVLSPNPVRKDPLAQSVLPDVTSGPDLDLKLFASNPSSVKNIVCEREGEI